MNTKVESLNDSKVYEIGYLLVSSLLEEKVQSEVEKIHNLVTKNGGSILSEEFPKKKNLAYQMIKKIGASNHRFKEGYFGWIKFEIPQSEVNNIKDALNNDNSVLRSLLINTVKENTYLGESAKDLVKELATEDVGTEDVEAPVENPVSVTGETIDSNVVSTASPEEIDKSIDDMVSKGTKAKS